MKPNKTERPPDVLSPMMGLVLLAAGCSVLWMFGHRASTEEAANLALASHNLPTVITSASQGAQMPLYYILLHGWQALFGSDVVASRFLSFLCYLVALPFAYAMGYEASKGDYRTGALSLGLFGLSPFTLWFSNKVTAYMLLTLIALLSHYYFVLIFRGKRSGWPGYLITGLLGMSVHYFFIIILLTQLLFCLIKHQLFTKRSALWLIASVVSFATAFALWVHYAASLGPFWHNFPPLGRPSATDPFIMYVQFLFGFQTVTVTTLILAFWPLVVIVALLAVQKYVRPPTGVQYLAFASFAPVLLAYIISWTIHPIFLSFYLIVSLPAFLLLLAWFLAAYNLRTLTLARNILLMSMLIMLVVELFIATTPIQAGYSRI